MKGGWGDREVNGQSAKLPRPFLWSFGQRRRRSNSIPSPWFICLFFFSRRASSALRALPGASGSRIVSARHGLPLLGRSMAACQAPGFKYVSAQ